MIVRAEFLIGEVHYRIVQAASGFWFIGKLSASGNAEERAEIAECHIDSTVRLAEEEPEIAAKIFEEALEDARSRSLNFARIEWDFVPYIRCKTVYVAFERNRNRH